MAGISRRFLYPVCPRRARRTAPRPSNPIRRAFKAVALRNPAPAGDARRTDLDLADKADFRLGQDPPPPGPPLPRWSGPPTSHEQRETRQI